MDEFRAADPDTTIRIFGVNEAGQASGNDLVVQELPMFQDTARVNVSSLWNATYRDVIVVDPRGRRVGTFNLSINDLQVPDSYAAMKKMIADAAEGGVK